MAKKWQFWKNSYDSECLKKYNNLQKHHITDLKEQEKRKYLLKYILLLISMNKMERRQVQE